MLDNAEISLMRAFLLSWGTLPKIIQMQAKEMARRVRLPWVAARQGSDLVVVLQRRFALLSTR